MPKKTVTIDVDENLLVVAIMKYQNYYMNMTVS
ncbi:Uncharacterised protein [Staphylococcus aureus]|nr:Uncharacterised protein [Staphylococcus aureus]